jgi:hypothetical protein
MTFHKPTQWKLPPEGTNLLGNYVILARYGQVKRDKVQAHIMKQNRIKCTYSNVLRIRVTHTMIPGSLPHGARPTATSEPGLWDGCCCC